MARAQIISMDFIMAFIIYMTALSVFFFSYQDTIKSSSLNIDPKQIFSKLSNMKDSFIVGSKIVSLGNFLTSYDPVILNQILKDAQPADYCIYLTNGTDIIRNFAATEKLGENKITFGNRKCGTDKNRKYYFPPECQGEDGLMVSKPVIFNKEIMTLNVLSCSK